MLKHSVLTTFLTFITNITFPLFSNAQSDPDLKLEEIKIQTITVIGRSESLIGEAQSAAEGKIGQTQLSTRPVLRPGEILESVPGLVISQHSGSGKANQYYLRGFNLDHGTDFSTSIDGMPINLPTHAHGHGYTDLNFLIPELVESISYRKGPYYADKGDFSSAGSADIHLFDKFDSSLLSFTFGKDNYLRALSAGSNKIADGNLLYAIEGQTYDGPWDNEENLGKANGVLRYSEGNRNNGFNLTALAYSNEWDSTDQIPRRLVDLEQISRFGNIDPSDGGYTSRYSLLGNYHNSTETASTNANVYTYYYRLNLFSNFTYFLDDPINGDQFEQADRRVGVGGDVSHQWADQLFGKETTHTLGFSVRNDSIPQVALYHTKGKGRLSTTRNDDVTETTGGLYAQTQTQWLNKFRSVLGLRGDMYFFDVNSDIDENSGNDFAGILSPKMGLIFGPWSKTEAYLNAGTGFHSNDARGVTINIDPTDRSSRADKVNPLVRSKGMEIGVRTALTDDLVSTISLWALDLDSELLFVGDAGTTEASRPSRRYGVEFANYYKANDWIKLDADLSLSRAYFKDEDISGDEIPGSVESVFDTGIIIGQNEGLFSDWRLRYFGPRPLIEDDSVRSNSTTLVNARVGYRFKTTGIFKTMTIFLDALNLFDRKDSDIDYYYASRLPGEANGGVNDIHFHPAEPAEYRLNFVATF